MPPSTNFHSPLPTRKPLQARQIPIKEIRIAPISIRVRVLPNRLIRPPAGDRAGGAGVAGQHERVGADKGVGVARAGRPPRRVGVEQRVPARLGVVPVAEGLDPRHHARRAQAPARGGALGLEVQHAGERDAVVGPAAAVGEEVVGLGGAGGLAGVRKVVAAADEAGVGGARVVCRELGVGVGGPFGCLGWG